MLLTPLAVFSVWIKEKNGSGLCIWKSICWEMGRRQPYLQKTISAKDTVIQNLIAQKEALHFEVTSLANILQKIQNAVANMNEEDRRVFSSMLETQEECKMVTPKEDNRIRDTIRDSAEQSPHKSCSMDAAENRALQLSRGYNSTGNHWQANNASNSCVSEASYFSACSPLSACSESQPRANVVSISVNERKDNCTISVHQLDLECSTTQAETSKDPGIKGRFKNGCHCPKNMKKKSRIPMQSGHGANPFGGTTRSCWVTHFLFFDFIEHLFPC
ncbi:hypothetical protein QQP08_006881 [Theobroma cacao]|nr:hypothetical protein QQP08_006881 [Theobroma cacao]